MVSAIPPLLGPIRLSFLIPVLFDGHVRVCRLVPFVRVLLLVEAELIPLGPLAPVLPLPLPILVGDEIAAHALVQGPAVERLGGPGHAVGCGRLAERGGAQLDRQDGA